MDLAFVIAALSLAGLLLFSELSAACFRRLSPFLEAWSKSRRAMELGETLEAAESPPKRDWQNTAILAWAFAGTIPLLAFSVSCMLFLDHQLNQTRNFISGALVGSNIVALGLLFGLILFSSQLTFFRIRTMTSPVFLFLATIAFVFASLDWKISFVEGAALWALAVGYAFYFRSFSSEWEYYQRHSNDAAEEFAGGLLSVFAVLCMGFGFLLCAILSVYPFAAWMAVFGAHNGYSSVMLGAQVIALLLAFPWLIRVLFTLGLSDTQKARSISSITHSCLLNILFLPGILAVFQPLEIGREMLLMDIPALLFFTGTFVATLLIEKQEGRALPSFIILAYILYVATGVLR